MSSKATETKKQHQHIHVSEDGGFAKFNGDGSFTVGSDIRDSIRQLAKGLQSPWMTEEAALREACCAFGVQYRVKQ